ncbi:MAG: CBS domain-containing protein [Anaerolineales bacterium]|nr:CBS domain-containing protein [Anaerolineales bacterium]
MLVGERMSHPVITVPPEMPIQEALSLFKSEHIRRAPVTRGGKMIGIVSESDLLNASPSAATSLSVWELNYLLSKITVQKVMRTEVVTIDSDCPIEEAARIMADNKVGGLPVMDDKKVVGMITETDLFKIFVELMGAREKGVRATVLIPDKPGQFARIGKALGDLNANIITMTTFLGKDTSTRMVTLKVVGLTKKQVRETISPLVESVLDIREG